MSKVRVSALAKERGETSKIVLERLNEMGEYVKSASSTIEAPVVRRYNEKFPASAEAPAKKAAARPSTPAKPATTRGRSGIPRGVGSGRAVGSGCPRACRVPRSRHVRPGGSGGLHPGCSRTVASGSGPRDARAEHSRPVGPRSRGPGRPGGP